MKRTNALILFTILLSSLALAGSSESVQNWLAFKASIGAGKSTRSQAVSMGNNSFVVVNRSLERVCTGDCQAADAVTAPGASRVLTDATRLWRADEYGACSNLCGAGERTRTVACVNGSGDAANGCEEEGRPEESAVCEDYSGCTYAWVQGGFEPCSATCGTATQTQMVACRRSDGVTVDDSSCAGVKPPASQSCVVTAGCGSCFAAKTANPSLGDGATTLTIDGTQVSVTCDMAGGGWTKCADSSNMDAHSARSWTSANFYKCDRVAGGATNFKVTMTATVNGVTRTKAWTYNSPSMLAGGNALAQTSSNESPAVIFGMCGNCAINGAAGAVPNNFNWFLLGFANDFGLTPMYAGCSGGPLNWIMHSPGVTTSAASGDIVTWRAGAPNIGYTCGNYGNKSSSMQIWVK